MSDTYDRQAETEVLRSLFPQMEDSAQLRRVVAGALRDRLTPRQRQTLLLYYAGGMNASQIARMRGVYPSTVWRTLKRARHELLWALRLGGVDISD